MTNKCRVTHVGELLRPVEETRRHRVNSWWSHPVLVVGRGVQQVLALAAVTFEPRCKVVNRCVIFDAILCVNQSRKIKWLD